MGKPVIVTDNGALAESVMPAATGWLVPPDDPDELARALDLALSLEEDVRQRLAARARPSSSASAAWSRCARDARRVPELLRPSYRARSGRGAGATAAEAPYLYPATRRLDSRGPHLEGAPARRFFTQSQARNS